MKITIYLILVLLTIGTVSANVVISEVLYDPINSERSAEAVELFNPTNETIDISNYKIKTKTSEKDAVIPNNTILLPYQFYLIADSNYSVSKDKIEYVNADHEESITLANSDAGVALIKENETIDAVGWGNTEEGLFKGTTLQLAEEGLSFQRKNLLENTNNNLNDFKISIPELRNSSFILDLSNIEQEVVEEVINETLGINETIEDIVEENETIEQINETIEEIVYIKVSPETNPTELINETINETVEQVNSYVNVPVRERLENKEEKIELNIESNDYPKEKRSFFDYAAPITQFLFILTMITIVGIKLFKKDLTNEGLTSKKQYKKFEKRVFKRYWDYMTLCLITTVFINKFNFLQLISLKKIRIGRDEVLG